jgi:hypothetical protein
MRKSIVVLYLLLFAGCSNPFAAKLRCEQITHLQSHLGTSMPRDEGVDWVSETFEISRHEVEDFYDLDHPDNGEYTWSERNATYSIFIEQGEIVDLRQSGRVGITLDSVISCLGEPEAYRATFSPNPGGMGLDLDLVYPSKGIFIGAWKQYDWSRQEAPRIDTSIYFPVSDVVVTRPGSTEQLLYRIYWGDIDDFYKEMLAKYQPWPDSLNELEVQVNLTGE